MSVLGNRKMQSQGQINKWVIDMLSRVGSCRRYEDVLMTAQDIAMKHYADTGQKIQAIMAHADVVSTLSDKDTIA